MNDPKIYLQILIGTTILSFGLLIIYFIVRIIKELASKSMDSIASEGFGDKDAMSQINFPILSAPSVENNYDMKVINNVSEILRQSSEILLNINPPSIKSSSSSTKSESQAGQ